jgi:hypothetical protein
VRTAVRKPSLFKWCAFGTIQARLSIRRQLFLNNGAKALNSNNNIYCGGELPILTGGPFAIAIDGFDNRPPCLHARDAQLRWVVEIAMFLFMKGYHHDERYDFGIRAAEARKSDSGDPATADPGQSREARGQAGPAAEVGCAVSN